MKISHRNYVCITTLLLACLTCLLWQRRTIAHLRNELNQVDAAASEPPAQATDFHAQVTGDDSQLNQIIGLQLEIERLRQLVAKRTDCFGRNLRS